MDYVQLLVTATLKTGERLDVTRMVSAQVSGNVATVSRLGIVRPTADGAAEIQLALAESVVGRSRFGTGHR